MEGEHPALTAFKKQYYGGRSHASELAPRGFVVLVIDAFYWGERRLQYKQPPPDFAARLANLDPATTEYVRAVNSYLSELAAMLVGWMTSLPAVLDISRSVHARMLDAFGLHGSMDHPDVASLGAPACALFVQQCGRDVLFTREGMVPAAERIAAVYQSMGKPERYRWKVFDVPHEFNVEMQEEAFQWLESWLAP